MNKSNIFKIAHRITKAAIKTGGNYSATFSESLKIVNAMDRDVVACIANGVLVIKRSKSGVVSLAPKNAVNDFYGFFRRNNTNFDFQIGLNCSIGFMNESRINVSYAKYDIKKAINYLAQTR